MPRKLRLRASLLAALALPAALLAACGGGSATTASTASASQTAASSAASTSGSSASAHGCREVSTPKPKGAQHLRKPSKPLASGRIYTLDVKTNCGSFTIRLATGKAPRTTASVASLARRGFYDGLTFHRIVPGFVIQGGDPLGNGTGGPGYTVVERPPHNLDYTRGVVAMAKAGNQPNGASGSQFFVVTGEDAQLPPQYALLGRVVKGQKVVDRIGVIPTDQAQKPVFPVVMQSVKLKSRPAS